MNAHIRTLLILLIGAALLCVTAPAASAGSYDVLSGPNTSQRYVLTFDDCISRGGVAHSASLANYQASVKWAQANGVGLVIAPTGQCVEHYRTRHGVDLVAYARTRGQFVIDHSYSHPNLDNLGYSGVRGQLGRVFRSNYGRPPYGADARSTTRRAYADEGMRRWKWDVDTNDWRGSSRSSCVSYVARNTGRGHTVLMHLQWNCFSPTALEQMTRGLAKRWLEPCRVWRGPDKTGSVQTAPALLPSNIC